MPALAELEVACEGKGHDSGEGGHNPDQAAAAAIALSCPRCDAPTTTMFVCQGRVDQLRAEAGALVECVDCGQASPLKSYLVQVLPLTKRRRSRTPKPQRAVSPRLDWDVALLEFERYQRAKGLSPRTIANRGHTIRMLAAHARRSPFDVSIGDVRDFLGRGVSRGTMQTNAGALKAFYTFMHEEGHLPSNPLEQLPTIRAPRGKPRPYTPDQIDALLGSGAYTRTRAMILLAYLQGLRRSEVAAIRGTDVDLTSNTLRVVGKGDKLAYLPLHPAVAELATKMPREGYWFPARRGRDGHINPGAVSDLIRRARERAGIPAGRLSAHSLRHAFATELVRAGVDLRTVQELMRHGSLATTQIYVATSSEQMTEGLKRLTAPSHEEEDAC